MEYFNRLLIMTLFKSPLRKRIEARIKELEKEIASNEATMSKLTEYKRLPEYCHYSVLQDKAKDKLNELKSLL